MMKRGTAVAAGALIAMVSAAAVAQMQTPKDPAAVIKERQEHMKKFGGAMKTIGTFVKKEGGTLGEVQSAAATIVERAKMDVTPLFPQGTAVGVGDTAAKPEIWQQWPKFQETAKSLAPQATKLLQAAQSGDQAAIAREFQATGKACGSCHDTFRQKKEG